MFNHAPVDPDSESTPVYSFDQLLDEAVVIVFDITGLRAEEYEALTGMVFGGLRSALKYSAKRDGKTLETPDLGFDGSTSVTATPTPEYGLETEAIEDLVNDAS